MTARPGPPLGNVLGKWRRPFALLLRSYARKGAFLPEGCSRREAPGGPDVDAAESPPVSWTRGAEGGSVEGPMGLPCVKSGRFARMGGAVAPLPVINGLFAQPDTGIGALAVTKGLFHGRGAETQPKCGKRPFRTLGYRNRDPCCDERPLRTDRLYFGSATCDERPLVASERRPRPRRNGSREPISTKCRHSLPRPPEHERHPLSRVSVSPPGCSPQKHSAGTEGPVRQTLRRSEANGPFHVSRTFLRGTPRRASG